MTKEAAYIKRVKAWRNIVRVLHRLPPARKWQCHYWNSTEGAWFNFCSIMLEERTRLAEIIIKRGWELAEIRIPTDTWIAQFNATQKMLKHHQFSPLHFISSIWHPNPSHTVHPNVTKVEKTISRKAYRSKATSAKTDRRVWCGGCSNHSRKQVLISCKRSSYNSWYVFVEDFSIGAPVSWHEL